MICENERRVIPVSGRRIEARFIQRRQGVTQEVILAVDCGTQSLRTLIFSLKGEMLARAQVDYEPHETPNPGWAEKDPEVYWESLIQGCDTLRRDHGDLFGRIQGVGVTTQRSSMVNVDREGRVLRPAIIWLDQRKARPRIGGKGPLKHLLKYTGLENMVVGIQSQGKCSWIRDNQPDIWEATHKYLQISGFLNLRLTGQSRDSVASQIGHLPFNYRKMKWAAGHELPSLFFPVEREKLPELVNPGEPIGGISRKASRLTGLPQGLPVIACGSDKGCETLGAGVLDETMASLSFGTTATVQTTTRKYFEPIRFMPPYPASVPGHYNPEVEIFRGFWMITWFKKEFAHKEVEEAGARGMAPEELLDLHLAATRPGAMGLVVQPYWGPGLEHPGAKGAMIGFGDIHTKAHIYRAVIEGLAFALREGLEKMEKRGKFKVQRAAVSGGASQSDEICRIAADILGIPMVKGRTHETSGLGAAIITARGLGHFSSFEDAAAAMARVERVFEPDSAHVPIYQELYHKVYKKMFRALSPLYNNIRDITGYPE
ncbi:MAG: carbohydrate kinase [Desulfobacteraceae bacterium 4572_89]|nr:MAG: carbohydrate kinase [Desulfobacteraceae bacterium 4572_89]